MAEPSTIRAKDQFPGEETMSTLRTRVAVLLSALALLLAGAAVGLTAGEANAASVVTQSSSNPADWNWPTFQQGSSGLDVRTIQYLLNARGASLMVDGIFGPRTNAAVRSFQWSHGLAVDGIVGQHTWSSLLITVQRGSTGSAVRAA
jgi:peptidoglycan hydrolase-like protein with peptidoglycan-binding domain